MFAYALTISLACFAIGFVAAYAWDNRAAIMAALFLKPK